MAMQADEIQRLIEAGLPGAEVKIEDLAGDGEHYRAHVKATQFAGMNRVQQHQLVYRCLGDSMKSTLHALALMTQPLP